MPNDLDLGIRFSVLTADGRAETREERCPACRSCVAEAEPALASVSGLRSLRLKKLRPRIDLRPLRSLVDSLGDTSALLSEGATVGEATCVASAEALEDDEVLRRKKGMLDEEVIPPPPSDLPSWPACDPDLT